MILMSVVLDDTMAVRGFEHHTYSCSACNEVERRFVFAKRTDDAAATTDAAAKPVTPDVVPSISPAAIEPSEGPATGLLRRVVAKLRRG